MKLAIALGLLTLVGIGMGVYSYHDQLLGAPTFSPAYSIDVDYYSKVSYCDVDKINKWNCGASCNRHSGMREVEAFNNNAWQSQGYCGYDSKNNRVVVAYRGSSNIKNWIANFEFLPVNYPDCNGCKIHDGFSKVLNGISSKINTCVKKLASKYPSAKVVVTGHSLGAAVATLSALEISKFIAKDRIVFINFGSPRVGNQAFVNHFMSRIPNGLRVVNYKDPVPHLPPKNLFGFKHINTEVWMLDAHSADKYKVCTIEEDPKCSDSVRLFNVADHTDYFGFSTGC